MRVALGQPKGHHGIAKSRLALTNLVVSKTQCYSVTAQLTQATVLRDLHQRATATMQRGAACLLCLLMLTGCADARDAERVELQLVTDGAGLEPITTDLGYEVELASAQVAVDDLKFTIAGEVHASLWQNLADAVVKPAHAHPGHFQGGEVTGELPGHFLLQFAPGATHELGTATLLVGKYQSVSLTLSQVSTRDVPESDPLLGHTALLIGTAIKNGNSIDFEVSLDSPVGRELAGIPFEENVDVAKDEKLALRLFMRDPLENDTLFDGVDFATLDVDTDGRVVIDPAATDAASVAAYNIVRRAFQSHDHFLVQREGLQPISTKEP